MSSGKAKFTLLLVDDEPAVIDILEAILSEEGYVIHTAGSGEEALDSMRGRRIDAALLDLHLPGMNGLDLLKEVKKLYPPAQVIILTGAGGVKEAVEAMKNGAVDFLQKPFMREALRARVAQLYQIWQLNEENRNLREEMEFTFGFDRLVGNSRVMLDLKSMITRIGPTDTSVLIQGETGTGKELVAKALHFHSRRAEEVFIPIDCASISESIMESEVFGHVKGAFTGAGVSSPGLIRSAEQGTVFFDEIGDLSPAAQSKLLRVIQEREVRPVGSVKSYPVDVRIIAATNRDLEEEVVQGRFREDLFYRLNVVTVWVPSLRKHREDIPLLARFFVKFLGTEFSPVKDISKEALVFLENYGWPGNIRELENVIRRALALGKGSEITPEDLPRNITGAKAASGQDAALPEDALASFEVSAIRNALVKSGGNREKAAQILGIGVATLYRKIKRYKIVG